MDKKKNKKERGMDPRDLLSNDSDFTAEKKCEERNENDRRIES